MQQLSVQENLPVRKNRFVSVKRVGLVLGIASVITLVGPMSSALARTQKSDWQQIKGTGFNATLTTIGKASSKAFNGARWWCRSRGYGEPVIFEGGKITSEFSRDGKWVRGVIKHSCQRKNV